MIGREGIPWVRLPNRSHFYAGARIMDSARTPATTDDVIAFLENVMTGVEGEPEMDLAGQFVGMNPGKLRDRLRAADMLLKHLAATEADATEDWAKMPDVPRLELADG